MSLKQKDNESNGSPGGNPRATQSDPVLKSLAEKAADLSADTFLSADTLKLTECQRTALIKTLELMENDGIDNNSFKNGKRFSMSVWALDDIHSCGTVCCIGGTASLLDGNYTWKDGKSIFHNDRGRLNTGDGNLHNLFYDWGDSDDVSVKRTARQLRKYLETGECGPRWGNYS